MQPTNSSLKKSRVLTVPVLALCLASAGLIVAVPSASAACLGLSGNTGCAGAFLPDSGGPSGTCVGIKKYESGYCTGFQV